ncbi:MAG: peptide deformylase [Lactobacillaceae bacterium]|jgi:peptide deformylase|nr:peptide deformylase [Lactobacillaceae bacterium]
MTVLKVCEYPHPVLKKKAARVEKVDDELRAFLDDMLETMYASDGVGLAAPQVGVSRRIVVIDIEQEEKGKRGNPLFFINPEIIWNSPEKEICDEGCLSIPGQRAEVERFAAVKVRYWDYDGKEHIILGEDFLSVALQHEIDHLDGILYIDRISRIKRNMLVKKLEKMRKEEAEEEI